MARLPKVGGDNNNWGEILNSFLKVSHNDDGTLRPIDQTQVMGLTPALSSKLSVQGGQVGSISVGDGDKNHSINVRSSYLGGDDNGSSTSYDSTGRINMYAYQRAHFRSYGEVNRVYLMRKDAKGMYAYYGPKNLYDSDRNAIESGGFKPWVWVGAHYEANDHNSIHGHWEVEVPDTTGALQGRLEVPFIDQENPGAGIGVNITNIRTNLADFSVRATNGQVLRVGANNAHNKDILLSNSSDRATSGRRWAMRANNQTETGSNAGTNFQLLRYDDSGNLLGTGLGIRRSDGNVYIGTSNAQSARVTAVWDTAGHHGFYAVATVSPGAGASFSTDLTSVTDRAVQSRLTGDVNARYVAYADGKQEFGDGTNARDVNLYRSSATVLRTDNTLHVGTNIRLNTTSMGGGSGVIGIANASVVPAGTPTGGGVLFVEGGALKFKGSSGTVTTVAPA